MSGKLKRGFIQVYTGDGKGKTTASIGQAIRAMGRDLHIYMGQFMKHGEYGELITLQDFQDKMVIDQYGEEGLHVKKTPTQKDIKRAEKGLKTLRDNMISKRFDMIIGDEILVANHFDLLDLTSLLDLIKEKPTNVELILTGRKAPKEVIEKADLVTEMKEIKHPYQIDIEARKGIEY